MGLLMDTVKSLVDMKKLSNLQSIIDDEIKQLEADGKLPDELKTAYETLKNGGSTNTGNIEDALKPLQEFIGLLEKYENIMPDSIKNIITKFESIEKDLEGVAGDIESKTKTN